MDNRNRETAKNEKDSGKNKRAAQVLATALALALALGALAGPAQGQTAEQKNQQKYSSVRHALAEKN